MTSNNSIIVIQDPDVKWNPETGSYVIFGEHKVEDLNRKVAAAENFKQKSTTQVSPVASTNPVDDEDSDGEVDYSQLEEKHIKMVVNQAGVSRLLATKSLIKNGNDIVNARIVKKVLFFSKVNMNSSSDNNSGVDNLPADILHDVLLMDHIL